MKYFRWAEKDVMNMTYEKFTMYLSTIPSYEKPDDKEGQPKDKKEVTGSFNLFDFADRH